jgi:predicted DNA-binding transcriptional regulator AlpA
MRQTDTVLSEAGAAHYLNRSVRWLQKLRKDGGGPNYQRLGLRRVAYSIAELDRWRAHRTFSSVANELASK